MNDAGMRALGLLFVAAALLLTASGSFGRTLVNTWAGTWNTQWGVMTLTQTGSKVAGTYTYDTGHISGTASGTTFTGRWTELPTRKGPNDAGTVKLTMGKDGKSMTGRWTYDGSPTSVHTDWAGKCTAGRCLQNAGVVTGTASSGSVEPKVWGTDWADAAIVLRTQTGSRFVFVCPAAGRKDQVWGTHIYADNSTVCSAALHDGAFVYENGGIVTIEHLAGQASYTGSTQNGITSASLGSWPGSFQIVSAVKGSDVAGVKMGGAGWTANATRFRGQNGGRYRYICPGGGNRSGKLYGSNTYTDDSSICTAGVYAGLFEPADGGRVTIQIAAGQSSYVSATSNGIRSQAFGSWPGSFTVVGAAPIPPGGGGGGTTTTTGGGGRATPPTGTATGTVLVNGRPFTGGAIPYNSTVDVTNGRLKLTADTGTLTVFGAGVSAVFKLLRGTDQKKPIVEMRLVKGDFSVCPKRKKSSAGKTTAATSTVRQLWGQGKGSFRTRGRYAAATVRGTYWLTRDRCDGTLVKVNQGVIQVNDLPKRTQVTVRAPRSYLAKP